MQWKLALLQNVLALPDEDPLRKATLEAGTIQAIDFGKRRVGRPKKRWADEALGEYWAKIQHVLCGQIRGLGGPSWRSGGGAKGCCIGCSRAKGLLLTDC